MSSNNYEFSGDSAGRRGGIKPGIHHRQRVVTQLGNEAGLAGLPSGIASGTPGNGATLRRRAGPAPGAPGRDAHVACGMANAARESRVAEHQRPGETIAQQIVRHCHPTPAAHARN